MSSRTNAPAPRGSSARPHPPDPAEDALADPAPPTDDTPTVISRQTPHALLSPGESARSVRGRKLAHFELIEPIGVGGMAAVLRARDTQLDRIVALKILPPEMSVDAENVRRFHQEARSAAKLDHENIARVFFCGEDQRLHFIAFEFVEGENLRSVLERRGRLPVGEALHYMLQVAAGLAHAAERGVVHRDIKPSNIIIGPTGRAKLVDMGLARSLVRKGDDDLTQSGVTLGTFDYISPEQALEPRDADTRSDIYSLGCTFYHVLTGRPPVPEGTGAKKIHCHQHVKPADPRDHVPGLPVEAVQVLDRMMAKRPADRYQSPEQLVQALLGVAQKLGLTHRPEAGGIAVEAPMPPSPAGRPLVWVGVAAVLVALIVLLADTGGGGKPRGDRVAQPARKEGKPALPEEKEKAKGKEPAKPPVKPPVEAKPVEVTVAEGMTQAELAERLAKVPPTADLVIVLATDLALAPPAGDDSGPVGLVVRARSVHLRSDRKAMRTISLRYEGQVLREGEELAALRLECQKATVEGVRFRIDAIKADIRMRAVVLPSGKGHEVKDCLFVQANPPPAGVSGAMASLSLGEGAEAALSGCAFLGEGGAAGQDALLLAASARVSARDCAFGPHEACARLPEGGEASLSACSILLPPRRSAVFDLAGKAAATLAGSVVARMPGAGEGAVLLRQAGEGARLKGGDNALCCLDGYWARGDDWKAAGWSAFREAMMEEDRFARLLPCRPWQASAPAQREALGAASLKEAFALAAHLPPLRRAGKLAGAQALLGERIVPGVLPATKEPDKRVLVVEKGAEDALNGVFGSLSSAMQSCRAGDSISIRHDGVLREQPPPLNSKERADLTIRAARGFKPVLALEETSDPSSELFRLHDGDLRLEGLGFRLGDEGRAQAVVALVGHGDCLMENCTVTLAKSEGAALSVALLPAAGGAMKMAGMPTGRPDRGPRLLLKDCLVRGEGDLISHRPARPGAALEARPALLEVRNSVAALSGSVFASEFDGDGKEPPAAHKVVLSLDRATCLLGGPLARVKARKSVRAAVPVECSVKASVLLPAAGSKWLLQREGPADDEEPPLKWAATSSGNAYGDWKALFAPPAGEEMPPAMMGEKLKKAVDDPEGTFDAKPRAEVKAALQEIGPKALGLAEEKPGAGASLPEAR
ncbi:MAG: protein kinase [Gemmataceae bacterium]|nr:protein kinase [Gemmataceae bacterium]